MKHYNIRVISFTILSTCKLGQWPQASIFTVTFYSVAWKLDYKHLNITFHFHNWLRIQYYTSNLFRYACEIVNRTNYLKQASSYKTDFTKMRSRRSVLQQDPEHYHDPFTPTLSPYKSWVRILDCSMALLCMFTRSVFLRTWSGH